MFFESGPQDADLHPFGDGSSRGPSTTLTVHVIRAMFGCDFVPPNLHLCRFGRRRWHGWAQAIAMLVTWA